MLTRIKFCGMTRAEDVGRAVDLGADALGFVFVKQSPRYLTIEGARNLIQKVPPFVGTVGLFMDAELDEIEAAVRRTGLNLLQFHGSEKEEFCRQFSMPYLKAVPVGSVDSIVSYCADFPSASGFVLDSHSAGQMGGTGKSFAWNRIPGSLDRPVILAGGLTPENVSQAVHEVRPYAVDVSSGIEVTRGIKDVEKMRKFIEETRNGQERA